MPYSLRTARPQKPKLPNQAQIYQFDKVHSYAFLDKSCFALAYELPICDSICSFKSHCIVHRRTLVLATTYNVSIIASVLPYHLLLSKTPSAQVPAQRYIVVDRHSRCVFYSFLKPAGVDYL